jgi:co-chaperonin GroES (HSP10)
MQITARKGFIITNDPTEVSGETKLESGIILTGKQFDKQDGYGIFAEVISVGEDIKDVVPGDEVMLNYYDATPFENNTKRYLSIKADIVMAKVMK